MKDELFIGEDNGNKTQEQLIEEYKQMKALHKSKYSEILKKYNKSYLIQNKKTQAIVEIRASSPFHASKIVGWKPKQTKLLQVTDLNED